MRWMYSCMGLTGKFISLRFTNVTDHRQQDGWLLNSTFDQFIQYKVHADNIEIALK